MANKRKQLLLTEPETPRWFVAGIILLAAGVLAAFLLFAR